MSSEQHKQSRTLLKIISPTGLSLSARIDRCQELSKSRGVGTASGSERFARVPLASNSLAIARGTDTALSLPRNLLCYNHQGE